MTLLAQTDTKPVQDIIGCLVMCLAMLAISFVPVMLHQDPPTDPARFVPVRPMKKEEFGKADPKRIGEIIPAAKLVACLFSQKAVRHHFQPAKVSFPACSAPSMQTTISGDLIDITVSGVATIGKVDRPFTVTLQHNPPSVTEDGLIVTDISVRAYSTQ